MPQFVVEKVPILLGVPKSVREAFVGLTLKTQEDKPGDKHVFLTDFSTIEEALWRRGGDDAIAAREWLCDARSAKQIDSTVRIGNIFCRVL